MNFVWSSDNYSISQTSIKQWINKTIPCQSAINTALKIMDFDKDPKS